MGIGPLGFEVDTGIPARVLAVCGLSRERVRREREGC